MLVSGGRGFRVFKSVLSAVLQRFIKRKRLVRFEALCKSYLLHILMESPSFSYLILWSSNTFSGYIFFLCLEFFFELVELPSACST